ncbi:hypothetical protein GCM10029964_045140 [Kibdelosporangium lantanae]
MTPFRLRPAEPGDADFLVDALCQAVNWSPAWKPQSREKVLRNPDFNKYVADWPRPGDWGVVAEAPDRSVLPGFGCSPWTLRDTGSSRPTCRS